MAPAIRSMIVGEGVVRACFVCTRVDVARTMNICATANSSLLFIVVNTNFSNSGCFLTLDVYSGDGLGDKRIDNRDCRP